METEQNKVYIVTSGEYSDYTIERVFSMREQAEEYLDMCDDNFRVEEYIVDEPLPEREEILYCISLPYLDNATNKKSWMSKPDVYTNIVQYAGDTEKVDTIHLNNKSSRYGYLEVYVWSDSKERAIKVARERFGAVKANELNMYPYLREEVIITKWGGRETPYYHFPTGKIVLVGNQRDIIKLKKDFYE